jgi:hypothetical protein
MQSNRLLFGIMFFMIFSAFTSLPCTGQTAGDFSLSQLLNRASTDSEQTRYCENIEADSKKFAVTAAKLQMLCEGALRQGSYLDRRSDPTRLTNQKQLRPAYRFFRLFVSFQLELEKIAARYEVPLVFNHSDKVEKYFKGYLLGISARFCRLMCVSELMNFLHQRPRLCEVLNEKNDEFEIAARSVDSTVKSALHPKSLAHLYRFRISHLEETAATLGKNYSSDTGMPAAYLVANRSILDQLSQKVANDPAWKFLSMSIINHSLDFILPAQRTVFTWVGDTRIKKQNSRLISGMQRHRFGRMLEPGDIVLGRQDWYLSNIFLPGFWPHAMLYVGSEAEVAKKFNRDPETLKWCKNQGAKNFTELLHQDFPRACISWASKGASDNKPRVILEAISDGIVFESLDTSCYCDYLSAIRPNLAPVAVARAIYQAFSYFGREYDFQFSFNSEQTLVCTELVSKSYIGKEGESLSFPLTERFGKTGITADSMVETFAGEQGKANPRLRFVAFLKGIPHLNKAIFAPASELAGSYKWRGGLQSPQTRQ